MILRLELAGIIITTIIIVTILETCPECINHFPTVKIDSNGSEVNQSSYEFFSSFFFINEK